MTLRVLAGLGLVLAGAILAVPVAGVLGIIILVLEIVHAIWATRGLRGVAYTRRLAAPRMAWGDAMPLEIEVWNRKRLPLAWLRADDATTDGLVVLERPSVETEAYGPTLRNTWTLAPYERVIRHHHLDRAWRVLECRDEDVVAGVVREDPALHREVHVPSPILGMNRHDQHAIGVQIERSIVQLRLGVIVVGKAFPLQPAQQAVLLRLISQFVNGIDQNNNALAGMVAGDCGGRVDEGEILQIRNRRHPGFSNIFINLQSRNIAGCG